MSQKISIKKASMIYAGAKYVTVIVGILISAVLSRLLTPDDYGVVAVVTVFTTFFSTLANLGFGTGVIQNKSLDKNEINSIFSFTVWISIALSVLLCIASVPISVFFENDVYIPVCCLLALSVFFNSMNMIPNSLLLKEQRFLDVGLRMIISSVLSGVIAIILALFGWKYYALVLQSILLAGIQLVWNLASVRLKFKLRFKMTAIKKIANYSLNQFFYNVINMLAQNLDNLLTGKLMGSAQLAFYNKSYTLMRYPVNNIPHAISPVLHPILSNYQDDKKYIYKKYVEFIKVISLIGVFCFAVFHGLSKEIVLVMFGDQWYEAVPSVHIFSWCIWAQLVNAIAGSIYQSLGNTKEMFHSGIVHVFLTIAAILIGALSNNISILAFCVMLSLNVKFLVETYFLIKKSFGFSIIKYLKNFIPEFLIMAIIGIFDWGMDSLFTFGLIDGLLIKGACLTALFLLLIILFRQHKYIVAFLPEKIKKKFRRGK